MEEKAGQAEKGCLLHYCFNFNGLTSIKGTLSDLPMFIYLFIFFISLYHASLSDRWVRLELDLLWVGLEFGSRVEIPLRVE